MIDNEAVRRNLLARAEEEGLSDLAEAIKDGSASVIQAQLYFTNYKEREKSFFKVAPTKARLQEAVADYRLWSDILDWNLEDEFDHEDVLNKTRELEALIPKLVEDLLLLEAELKERIRPTWKVKETK